MPREGLDIALTTFHLSDGTTDSVDGVQGSRVFLALNTMVYADTIDENL